MQIRILIVRFCASLRIHKLKQKVADRKEEMITRTGALRSVTSMTIITFTLEVV